MAFTQRQLEEVARWAADTVDLAQERREARRYFFGEDDPRPIAYWSGAEESVSRKRRFLGYFLFDHRLPDGQTSAERGVQALFRGIERDEALRAVRGTRYVMAVVRSILPGRAVFLEVETERFEVRNREWSWRFFRGGNVYAHLVPSRHGIWLAPPGWFQMGLELGPGMLAHLSDLQPDPISVERMIQGRSAESAGTMR